MNRVKFHLRGNLTTDPTIRMTLMHNGKKFVYGTGKQIPEKLWDKKSMRASKAYAKHGLLNRYLNNLENHQIQTMEHFEANNMKPSNAQIKNKLEQLIFERKKHHVQKFIEITPYIIQYIEKRKKDNDLASGTLQGYNQLQARWREFPLAYGLSFDELDIETLTQFQIFMKAYGYAQSQREKIQRKFISILRYAENADKINVSSDYKLTYWRVGVPKDSIKVVMTNAEIKRIRDHSLPIGSNLEKVRDRWIIGFATGQRYSDFKGISKDNIRDINDKLFLEVIQKKTGKVVNIPLYEDVIAIFEKYEGYPPVFTDQSFNKFIKEVAKEIGFDSMVTKILQVSPTEKKITEHEKWELVTSHICRRSFATNGSLKGISMGYLMEITGHTKAQT
ncbi:site-specific integrase, partial [Saprospiraceae bacterium]|nr:site-specific integrase [Saprospiraceae bacterium]